MGDRANVLVKSKYSGEVYLYTHWSGTELPEILQNALNKHWRWNDPYYLARIIFSEMIKDNIDGETGYGISQRVSDGDDRVLLVNTDTQTVSFIMNGRLTEQLSFEEYVKQPDVHWYCAQEIKS